MSTLLAVPPATCVVSIDVRLYWPFSYPVPFPASWYRVNWPDRPGYTRRVSGAFGLAPTWSIGACSGTIPPALTKTGIRSSGTVSVCVEGPWNVAPVNQSVHVPGGNHIRSVVTLPGVVTGATSMSGPYRYSPGLAYAAAAPG